MSQNRWLSDLHWRRQSQQTRAEKTQNALMDAAEKLILEKGTDSTSITEIAKLAGCSVGALYHHFKDKDALYYALFHRWTQSLSDLNKQAANPALWEGASVRDVFSGYIDIVMRVREEGAAAKAAGALVMADNPELHQHMAEIAGEGRRIVMDLILQRRREIHHANPEWAVAFAIDQIGAMLVARFDPNLRVSAISDTDDEVFKREAVGFVAHFLGLKPQD